MNEQLDLYSRVRVTRETTQQGLAHSHFLATDVVEHLSPRYVAGSKTSQDAARSISEGAPTLRAKVLAFLRSQPRGASDEEVQVALGMNPSTERPRRIELCEAGLVVDLGERRPTSSGRMATVWYAPFTGEPVAGPPPCGCTEDCLCDGCAAR